MRVIDREYISDRPDVTVSTIYHRPNHRPCIPPPPRLKMMDRRPPHHPKSSLLKLVGMVTRIPTDCRRVASTLKNKEDVVVVVHCPPCRHHRPDRSMSEGRRGSFLCCRYRFRRLSSVLSLFLFGLWMTTRRRSDDRGTRIVRIVRRCEGPYSRIVVGTDRGRSSTHGSTRDMTLRSPIGESSSPSRIPPPPSS